jgi:23S rRNA pseudouridine1911/1915/1917 synthase
MTERAAMHTIVAEVAERIDKAIARAFPDAGRRHLAELFADGAVHVRGKRAKKGDRVAPGDVIELARAPAYGDALRAVPDPDAAAALDVLIERADLVAIAKPAGVPSQPLRAGERGTIANALAARWPECAALGTDPRDAGLVHRLDIGTSGVLVAARTAAAHRALRDAFAGGHVVKRYLAIVCGTPVARACDAPLAQRGDHVVVDHVDGLPAETTFAVERTSSVHAPASYALVRCTARTGRMHQVRAHLAHVGAPIAGDARYGGAPIAGLDDAGFFLHASRIELPQLAIDAPVPPRFAAALAAVGLAP